MLIKFENRLFDVSDISYIDWVKVIGQNNYSYNIYLKGLLSPIIIYKQQIEDIKKSHAKISTYWKESKQQDTIINI